MMLFKCLLPKCSGVLGTNGKLAAALWRYTLKRYAGRGMRKSNIEGEESQYESADIWHMDHYTCRQLVEQHHSPTNLVTSRAVERHYPPFTFDNFDSRDVKMVLVNNGFLVKIDFPESSLQVVGGGLTDTYKVDHLHFHWGSTNETGSEHYKNGANFPMEMHIVCHNMLYPNVPEAENNRTGLAVLCFLFEISNESNPALRPIIDKLPEITTPYLLPVHKLTIGKTIWWFPLAYHTHIGDTSVPLELPSLKSIIPHNLEDFYQYTDASLRMYPFITWTVFNETILISEDQIEQFRKLNSNEVDPITKEPLPLGDNNRDPEELPKLWLFSSFRQTHKEHRKKGNAFGRFIYKYVCCAGVKKRT